MKKAYYLHFFAFIILDTVCIWNGLLLSKSSAQPKAQFNNGPGLGIESPSPLGSHSMTLNVTLSVLSPAEILVIPRRHRAWPGPTWLPSWPHSSSFTWTLAPAWIISALGRIHGTAWSILKDERFRHSKDATTAYCLPVVHYAQVVGVV